MHKKFAGFGMPLFFILPVAGFIAALFDLRSKTSAFVYIAFAMLFGYAISFTNTSADSYRYAAAFSQFDNTLDYNTIVQLYREGELKDMYRLLLFYFVSLFSGNPKVMYAFAGLVYGVLSYLSLRIFAKENGGKLDSFVIILGLIFYTYISLTNINGFRFWTGGVLLFYSIYKFIIQKKTIWFLGILITPLFHYGFILIVPFFLLYKFIEPALYTKNRVNTLLFYSFLLAFIASWLLKTNSIHLGFLSQTDLLSGAAGERIEFLNSENTAGLVDSRREASSFLSVQKYFDYGIKAFIFLSILYMRQWLKNMKGDKTNYTQLFALVLFFYTIAFFATSIPSGGRFLQIAHLFLILLFAKFYVIYKGRNIKRLIVMGLIVFSFNIAFTNLMAPLLFLSPTFWYTNLFWTILEGVNYIIR